MTKKILLRKEELNEICKFRNSKKIDKDITVIEFEFDENHNMTVVYSNTMRLM